MKNVAKIDKKYITAWEVQKLMKVSYKSAIRLMHTVFKDVIECEWPLGKGKVYKYRRVNKAEVMLQIQKAGELN